MRPLLVTAYVPIQNHPRGPQEYGALGERLGGCPVPKKAYYDQIQNLWLSKFIRGLPFIPAASQGDNPLKNTTAYHAVNHEKTFWIAQAAKDNPHADVIVWVDYGIFRLPGVTNEAIVRFMEHVDDKAIYAPGCWDPQPVEASYPCWRFCGSVLAVPSRLAGELHSAVSTEARQHIRSTLNVEWEVNTWARTEARKKWKLPWRWYKADHNVSMFWNLPALKEKSNDAPV